VRKTKLLAGCIVYLARNGYSRNLFVIAPGETIYAKLIREFTPGEPAYLFKGIGGMDDMRVVTGDDYLYREPLTNTDDPLTVSPSRGDRTRTCNPGFGDPSGASVGVSTAWLCGF
jgi:hypothetical protein